MTYQQVNSMTRNRWDDAFENMAHIPDSAELPALWAERAARYRHDCIEAKRELDTDTAYGDHPREVFDLVWPDAAPKGLLVFVHGGYWIRLDKSYWTDLAEGARANGWVVCLPSYTLAPEARISEITLQVGKAIGKAAALIPGPVRLAGHSAGGHLVSRMLCSDTALPANVMERIEHTVSISGLHDLRPLLNVEMNNLLKLDPAEAAIESAVLHTPLGYPSITAWVGGDERPEFIRQSHLLNLMWQSLDARITCHVDLQHNHFTVIEGMKNPDSAITREILKPIAGLSG